MASNQEFFYQCWSHEMPAFGRVLKALPDQQLHYKPHDKSTGAGDLAWQLAIEQKSLLPLLETGVVEFTLPQRPDSLEAIIAEFDQATAALEERLKNIDDAKWSSPGDFRMGGQSVWAAPIQELCWGFLFDMIHHRGQLSTYIRPMGGKVPSIYGPSGDDAGQG